MDGDGYKARVKELGKTQMGFADLLGVGPKAGQNWAKNGPSPIVLTILEMLKLSPEMLGVLERVAAAAGRGDGAAKPRGAPAHKKNQRRPE